MRYREAAADFEGNVAELLAKAVNQKALDSELTQEDREKLLEALRGWGMLDKDMRYTTNLMSSEHRGYERPPGGGVNGAPIPSQVFRFHDVLYSQVWKNMAFFMNHEMQTTMFQPVGGMGMIGKAFARQVQQLITFNAKVTRINQDKTGVTVTYADTGTGAVSEAKADFCVCAIPLGVLNQIPNNMAPEKRAAIAAVPYSNSVKIGLQMARRFWETDDYIYGGHSFTSQDIALVSYPNYHLFEDGPGVLVGAFATGAGAYRLAGMTPEQRIEAALAQGSVFHPRPIARNSRTAHPSPGTACPGRWAAAPAGTRRPARSITRRLSRWTTASCWRASMRLMWAAGWKARCCRRWMPSPVCTSARWRPDPWQDMSLALALMLSAAPAWAQGASGGDTPAAPATGRRRR